MDGIQSQSVPFVTIMDKGTLTSDHLDGAGTKMVKRSRETMESMIQEYERKTNEVKNPPKKKMKRTNKTKGYMGTYSAYTQPIASTRSPQALAIVKAKLIVDEEGHRNNPDSKQPKWIIPPHSLVFAKREREKSTISAVSDAQNFYNVQSTYVKYVPLGVSLEDGLDATKFHKEHESRRYFSVAVEGVVSLQCPLEEAQNFNFGDPVYIDMGNPNTDLETYYTGKFFRLGFYETTHFIPQKTPEVHGSFKIGYFVECVDTLRGGIRIKLDIQKDMNLKTLERDVAQFGFDVKDWRDYLGDAFNEASREQIGMEEYSTTIENELDARSELIQQKFTNLGLRVPRELINELVEKYKNYLEIGKVAEEKFREKKGKENASEKGESASEKGEETGAAGAAKRANANYAPTGAVYGAVALFEKKLAETKKEAYLSIPLFEKKLAEAKKDSLQQEKKRNEENADDDNKLKQEIIAKLQNIVNIQSPLNKKDIGTKDGSKFQKTFANWLEKFQDSSKGVNLPNFVKSLTNPVIKLKSMQRKTSLTEEKQKIVDDILEEIESMKEITSKITPLEI